MNTASDIADQLGRKRLARALGVAKSAVSNATAAGVFPSSWYLVVSDLCAASGVDCPMRVFSWREAKTDTTCAQMQVTECNGAPRTVAKITVGGDA